MRFVGVEVVKKAMWLYPKVSGFNPSERWGHSACCFDGVLYVFGGCCGGLHFSDVLMLDLGKMTWSKLITTGQQPGARDSHSAVLVGHKMIVFGGTNGSRKVNDLHILDLRTKEWSSPSCKGIPPSPRESHSATLVGDDKLVIFGGSGEGDVNYLNDLHVLNLRTLKWDSPEVRGDLPAPRDSHIAVAVDNKLLVYGGDRGDRYHGAVDVLDMETLTWSRLAVQGSSPGVRAGHAAVNIGTKVYIIGGVGDKRYYNDVWVLDIITCSWTQLDIRGQQPQGRFSHVAVVTDSEDIAIYGGCGEDERPLNELLILQLGAEHPTGRYNISLCKIFGSRGNQERKDLIRGAEIDLVFGNNGEQSKNLIGELDSKHSFLYSTDNLHNKRRRTSDSMAWEIESEQEEHSLSLSQHSSPSQSDHEQTPIQKLSSSFAESALASHSFGLLKQQNQISSKKRSNNLIMNQPDCRSSVHQTYPQDFNFLGGENLRQLKPKQFLHSNPGRQELQYLATEQKPGENGPIHTTVGAEVHGRVDGAFDSGYLMTATVNGKILRGVLFTPGPGFFSRGANPSSSSLLSPVNGAQAYSKSNCNATPFVKHQCHPMTFAMSESNHHLHQAQSPASAARNSPSLARASGFRTDLEDVVLTLGGSGAGA